MCQFCIGPGARKDMQSVQAMVQAALPLGADDPVDNLALDVLTVGKAAVRIYGKPQ